MDCAGLADAYLIGMSEGPTFDAAMERRFQEYVDHLGTVVGNDARRRGLSDYMTGLGDVPADVANGRALLINDYAASPVQARALSLVTVAQCAA